MKPLPSTGQLVCRSVGSDRLDSKGLIESTKVIIAIIMANKIEGSEIFDVPSQPKGWQALVSVS